MRRLFSSGSSLANFPHLSLAAAGNLSSQSIMFSLPNLILHVSRKRILTVVVTGCRIPNGSKMLDMADNISLFVFTWFNFRVVIWSVSN